ncbi:NXPE family member 3-like isoform X3 [Branchiostoma floridae x Branchiostoma belcheri]
MKSTKFRATSAFFFIFVACVFVMLYVSQLTKYAIKESNIQIGKSSYVSIQQKNILQWCYSNGSFNFDKITMGKHSVAFVMNPQPVYHVGDTLFIKIIARDAKHRPKFYGGDFLRAKLFSRVPVNASTTGRITDYGNGTYVARFFLSWPGNLSVSVQIIHPSEAVQVFKRLQNSSRRIVVCGFSDESGNVTEWMPCSSNTNVSMNLRDVCDFSKSFINATFYCQRPRLSRCDSLADCRRHREKSVTLINMLTNIDERNMLLRELGIEDLLSSIEGIQVRGRRILNKIEETTLPLCAPGLPETPSEGYWFNGTWYSLKCQSRKFPSVRSVFGCLQNKSVLFFGDSTIRQWWKFLKDLPKLHHTGSVVYHAAAVHGKYNTTLEFTFQHFPRNAVNDKIKLQFKILRYLAEEIDGIKGGPNVVLVLGLWGHYTAEPIETFRSRLYGIRYAIERLHSRYPDTKVIWRTSNTRDHSRWFHFLENSDWYAYQLLREAKKILKGLNIAIIDVWEMTSCMWHDPIMHVPEDVVRNQVDLLLSYICPL